MSKRTTPSRQRQPKGARPGKGTAAPDVQGMMAQVQRMQQEMAAAQEQLAQETVSASSGGGMVSVEVTGDLRVTSVTIDPQAVDPEDVEMLADMVTAAVNEALRAAQELAAGRMGGATEGLDLGDLGGLGGLGMPGL
jgi:DNA-binding YbaB/EbfC family protein